MIIDPHIHSKYSTCSKIGIKELFIVSIDNNLDGIIITDHNILSTKILDQLPIEYNDILKVFIGEEITTTKGDILAYGIYEEIPAGLSPEKTIKLIHDQNGIAVAAHPYRRKNKYGHSLLGLGDEIFNLELDAIEGVNGGNRAGFNRHAIKSGKILNLPIIGGSDAHSTEEIGCVVMKMPNFNNITEFITLIKKKEFLIQRI
ncbi:MAG: PHP domain-containing protein [Candidatus Helarchaeota archaeon]